ncbi:MAG: alpha/beta fold hydrolase [Phycisphaera sp.]|nr:alpha/beta fold hydrolase [Phycisphaera sp.]
MRQAPIEVERDGKTMRGCLYTPDADRRCPTVLFLHGFTGHRIESGFLFVRLARALNERGIAAVTFDFIHSGESDGSFDQMLVTGELKDALRMTDWLKGQPFVDRSRMGLLGFSLGGLLAGCVPARTNAFKTRVMLAPTTVENMCRHTSQEACAPTGTVTRGPHTLHRDFFKDIQTLDPVGDAAKVKIPTLIVQGTADTAVTPAVSEKFHQRMAQAGVPVTYHTIPEADHSFSQITWRTRLLDLVPGWLARQLA